MTLVKHCKWSSTKRTSSSFSEYTLSSPWYTWSIGSTLLILR